MDSNFFLDFSICKSSSGKDENGNYTFVVEASNENIDLQDQIVLQSALMESKDEFLKGGVISYDHLHKTRKPDGTVESNPSMIIGEPVDVWTDGKSTFVKGILYSTVEKAKEVIDLLKAGSTRIRASVGGIFPKIRKNSDGIEQIVHVLWNDLALTPSPVNNTVGNAVFAKSINANEFVGMYKSLTAGYGTEHAEFADGRAMQPESIGTAVIDVVPEDPDFSIMNDRINLNGTITKLIAAMENGELHSVKEAVKFLIDEGINDNQASTIVQEVINAGGKQSMFKGLFGRTVDEMIKSMKKPEDDDMEYAEDGENEDGSPGLFDDEDGDSENGDDNGSDDEEGDDDDSEEEETQKSIDATKILVTLAKELNSIKRKMNSLEKSIQDTGEATVALAGMVKSFSDEPIPMQATLSKSVEGGYSRGGDVPEGRPTKEEFEKVQRALIKSVQEGKIDMVKSCMYESEVQHCMNSGKKMSRECYEFLSKALKDM